MTKFDTNGLTEWLAETEAMLARPANRYDVFADGYKAHAGKTKARLEDILKSADSLEPKDGSAAEASVSPMALRELLDAAEFVIDAHNDGRLAGPGESRAINELSSAVQAVLASLAHETGGRSSTPSG